MQLFKVKIELDDNIIIIIIIIIMASCTGVGYCKLSP